MNAISFKIWFVYVHIVFRIKAHIGVLIHSEGILTMYNIILLCIKIKI